MLRQKLESVLSVEKCHGNHRHMHPGRKGQWEGATHREGRHAPPPQSSPRCPHTLRGLSHGLILDTVTLTRAAINRTEIHGRLSVLAAGDLSSLLSLVGSCTYKYADN